MLWPLICRQAVPSSVPLSLLMGEVVGVESWWQVAAVIAAGVVAGVINSVVGSGTLVTFPTLLACGVPPVTANVSNNIGLLAGGVSGTWGYRSQLRAVWTTFVRVWPFSVVGGACGAAALLLLPAAVFGVVVPVLVACSLVLVVAGPWVKQVVQRRRAKSVGVAGSGVASCWGLAVGMFGAGVYGGYFGAAQGVLLVGLLGVLTAHSLQEINGLKNACATLVNAVAAVLFVVIAPQAVDWPVVGMIAVGSLCGGAMGAWVGQRLSPGVLRGVIVVVGLLALWKLLM